MSGEIIAPEIRPAKEGDHNYFQYPEMFLALGGKRGKQLQVLTDGTFFINRWFTTVEIRPKTLIPIGYVGVVVSYYGAKGVDVTGQGFRYGEQVEFNERGVWKQTLVPGKYALNPYAMKVEFVSTINFVLRKDNPSPRNCLEKAKRPERARSGWRKPLFRCGKCGPLAIRGSTH